MITVAPTLKQRVLDAQQAIAQHVTGVIDSAILLGSGLSEVELDGFSSIATLSYADIAGFPRSTAPSHAGQLRILSNGSRNVAMCAGRHHLYEGHSAQEISILPYVLQQLGARRFIVTNAAGALNPNFRPGDVMLISDHINMTGQNPLIGQDQSFGITFPDMSEAYANELQQKAKQAASGLGLPIHNGVYLGVTGPSLETSAERRMFRLLGADAIGMSTVTEVIAANHCGMAVIGLSAITNLALGDENQQPDTIEDVLKNAAVAGAKIAQILPKLVND